MKHPVTQALLNTIKEHIIADKEDLLGEILNNGCYSVNDGMPKLLQLKGQIHAFEQIEDTHEFLSDYIEVDKDEV